MNEYLTIPLGSIFKLEKTTQERKTSKISYLEIFTKDFRHLKLSFDNFNDCNTVCDKLEDIAFPEDKQKNISGAFAFKHFIPDATDD